MQRILQNGQLVNELEDPVTLKVYTRCPEKYMLIDMETGQKYIGYATEGKNSWKPVE